MKLLTNLYRISSPSGNESRMAGFIEDWLNSKGINHEKDISGNIFVTKGESTTYPCIVAHMDEVHPKKPKGCEIVTFRDEIIFGYNTKKKAFRGIGADDKNGIWICLKALETFAEMKCVFFVEEETGRIGSKNASLSFFKDCRYVLQCDRKGNSDLITKIDNVELCCTEFINCINPSDYNYKVKKGLPTDVYALKLRGLPVSCINISCGYYNPHTDEEYTVISHLEHCLKFVFHIVESCKEVSPHSYKPYPSYYYDNGWGSNIYRKYYPPKDFYQKKIEYDALIEDIICLLQVQPYLSCDDCYETFKNLYPFLNLDDYQNAFMEASNFI